MPISKKRKRSRASSRKSLKKRKTGATAVVVRHPRKRSTIKKGLINKDETLVRSFETNYFLNSGAGDLAGSTMFFEGYHVHQPWSGAHTIPTNSTVKPFGWTQWESQYEDYVVLGAQLFFEWETMNRGLDDGQVLSVAWTGDFDDSQRPVTDDYNELYGDPRSRVISSDGAVDIAYGTGDSTDVIEAKRHIMKTYRKPIMLMGKDEKDKLMEDYPQRTIGTPVTPDDALRWGCWINILPKYLSILTTIYYRLRIRVKWYIRFQNPIDYAGN